MNDVEDVIEAIVHLQQARGLLIRANCPKAAQRVRLALSSAKGARRNAENRAVRIRRKATE